MDAPPPALGLHPLQQGLRLLLRAQGARVCSGGGRQRPAKPQAPPVGSGSGRGSGFIHVGGSSETLGAPCGETESIQSIPRGAETVRGRRDLQSSCGAVAAHGQGQNLAAAGGAQHGKCKRRGLG